MTSHRQVFIGADSGPALNLNPNRVKTRLDVIR